MLLQSGLAASVAAVTLAVALDLNESFKYLLLGAAAARLWQRCSPVPRSAGRRTEQLSPTYAQRSVPTRPLAEQALADVLADEPLFVNLLMIAEVSQSDSENALN